MPFRRRRAPARSSAVLLLSRETAEWFERSVDGHAVYAAESVLGPSPEDLVRAAVAARRAAGGQSRTCVVALAGGLVEQRSIGLPELQRNDLLKVLPRKAAALLESTVEDAFYAALPFARDDRQDGEIHHEQKWYLVALRRGYSTALSLALRRERFDVVRMVDAPSARLCSANQARGAHEEACIVIDVQREDVYVSLISHEALRMQNRIRGSFETVPTMALSLIQEIKSFDAFWRKLSRGVSVAQVVVIGLEIERCRLFSNAVASAIADVRVTQLCEAEPWRAASALGAVGRMTSAAACAAEGPFMLDLTVPLPARPSRVAALVSILISATVGVGLLAHTGFSRSLESVLADKRRLDGQAIELETLRETNRRSARALDLAVYEGERLVAAGTLGVPLAAVIGETLGAVGDDGELMTLSARRTAEGGRLTFGGRIDPDPMLSTRALERMRIELAAVEWLDDIEVDAPRIAVGPGGARSGAAPLEFQLTATWQKRTP